MEDRFDSKKWMKETEDRFSKRDMADRIEKRMGEIGDTFVCKRDMKEIEWKKDGRDKR